MLLLYHRRWIRPLGMFGSSEWWGNFVFFVAGMELRSCERTPHRSQGPQNAYSLPGASFIPVVGRPWPIQLRSPRYLVSSLTSWCGVLYISVSISWTRSFLLLRTHFVRGIEFAINVPTSWTRSFLILRTRFARSGEFATHTPHASSR